MDKTIKMVDESKLKFNLEKWHWGAKKTLYEDLYTFKDSFLIGMLNRNKNIYAARFMTTNDLLIYICIATKGEYRKINFDLMIGNSNPVELLKNIKVMQPFISDEKNSNIYEICISKYPEAIIFPYSDEQIEPVIEQKEYIGGSIYYEISYSDTLICADTLPTDTQLQYYKKGVLAERERLWDVTADESLALMKKILNY